MGPAAFLEALPSTAAGVLGILFGLSEYQATVVGGALAGLEALRHALDLLAGGRLERVLVAALGVREGEFRSAPGGASVRLAAALALESANVAAPPGLYIRIACGVTPGEDGLEPPYGRQGALLELSAPGREVGAAPLFLAAIAARRMEEDPTAPPCVLINQVDPATGERGWAFITNEREERSVGCPPRRP